MIPFEYGGIVVLTFYLIIANFCGNAGGGLIVPLAQIFFGFNVKTSISISNVCVFTCTFTRYWYSIKDSHPKKANVLLPDYTVATILLPSYMAGSMIGN